MSGWTVYVEGEREVRKSLRAAGESVRELSKVHRVVAKEAKADLRAAFPARTGRARASGKHYATATQARVVFRTPYIRKQEFRPHGKRSMNSSGWYFGPKAERTHNKWMETYWREFTAMMDRAFGS